MTIKLKGVPTLRIGDVELTKRFYQDFLGFTVDWEHYYAEGAPVYMQVSRDGLVLHLSENPRFIERVVVFVETHGMEDLRSEFIKREGEWAVPEVNSTPWGTKQVELEDPFGNFLRFNETEAR